MAVLRHASIDRDLGLFEDLSSSIFNVNCPGVNLVNRYRINGAGNRYLENTLIREPCFGRIQVVWNSPSAHDTPHDALWSANQDQQYRHGQYQRGDSKNDIIRLFQN